MSNANERRIKLLIILLTMLWHGLILYTFFVLTSKESYEPLRITVKPQVIEYLLNSLPQQQNNPVAKALPSLPPALAAADKNLPKLRCSNPMMRMDLNSICLKMLYLMVLIIKAP